MLGRFSAQLPPVRLGLTTHAGEDFDDPVTGLRHIFESIELLDLQPGDRLGHALVLGLDAEAAFKLLLTRARGSRRHQVRKIDGSESVQVCMPRGTHLLDLVWEQRLQRETGDVTAAHRLACVLPGASGVPPRWDCGLLSASQAGLQIHIPGVRYRKLEEEVSAHHFEWVLIDEAWKIRYQRLREHVLRKVRCCELVIESCPTSNCTVANLSEAPLKALLQVSPPLRVTVATDDPGLLDAYPAAELERHLKDSRLRQRVLDEGRRASFIYGED